MYVCTYLYDSRCGHTNYEQLVTRIHYIKGCNKLYNLDVCKVVQPIRANENEPARTS